MAYDGARGNPKQTTAAVCPGSTTCMTKKRAYACKHSTAWVNSQQGICVQKLHNMHEQPRRERQRRARTAPPVWKPDTIPGHIRAKDTGTQYVLGGTHCTTVVTHNPHPLQSTTVHTHTKLETQRRCTALQTPKCGHCNRACRA
jgi:hypothetical protein